MQSTIPFFLLFLATFVSRVNGHGFQCYPPGRGLQNTQSVLRTLPRRFDLRSRIIRVRSMKSDGMEADNCPHCLNSGGKGAVVLASKGKWTPYEPLNKKIRFRHDSGLCGDPISQRRPRDHEAGGKYYPRSPITATYKQGSVVEFIVDLTTNHQGYFEYFICDAKKCGGDINAACFQKGHCHQLMREKTPECESSKSKECAPVDPKYPGRWYIGCRKGNHVDEHFVGGKYMRYHLPKGFNTKHAVLQWYWVTANSCNPPGFIDFFKRYPMDAWGKCGGDGGTIGGRNPTIAECGGSKFPEEFWNCADVEVSSSGQASGTHDNDDDDTGKEDLSEKKGSANKKPSLNQPKPNAPGTAKRAQPKSQKPQKAMVIHRPKRSHPQSHQRQHNIGLHNKLKNQPERRHSPKKNHNRHRTRVHNRRNRSKPKRRNQTRGRGRNARSWRNKNKRRLHNRWMAKRRWKRRSQWRRNQWRMKRRQRRINRRRMRRRAQWRRNKRSQWQRRRNNKRRFQWRRQRNNKRRMQWRRQRSHWRRKRRNGGRFRRGRQSRRNRRKVGGRNNGWRKKGWGWKNGKRCVVNWNQCGGKFYTGPSHCCGRNYKCVRKNRFYSQCKWQR